MKTVMVVGGIRPDWVRLSEVIRKLDAEPSIKMVLVHTGQHFDPGLSDVFFEDLDIREPDFNLGCGGPDKTHYEVVGEVTNKLINNVINQRGIHPDIILFLGDSNSVVCSVALKKEGYTIGHIEAGMRSGDRRMLEETNRIVCDHCSDVLFVYHQDYANNLRHENIWNGVHVVGNTIVEVAKKYGKLLFDREKSGGFILLDIHRPENFRDKHRLLSIFEYAHACNREYKVPVKFVRFDRTIKCLYEFGIDGVLRQDWLEISPLMSYTEFLAAQYNSLFMISNPRPWRVNMPARASP